MKEPLITQNSKKEEEIKFGGVFLFFWITKGEIQKRVKRERSKAEGYNRKERLKEEVLSCGLTLLNN